MKVLQERRRAAGGGAHGAQGQPLEEERRRCRGFHERCWGYDVGRKVKACCFLLISIYIYIYIDIDIDRYRYIMHFAILCFELKTCWNSITMDIYVYMVSCSVFLPPPPPNGMGPQVAPPSLLFASYWQHFWGPASYSSLAFTRYMLPFRRPT